MPMGGGRRGGGRYGSVFSENVFKTNAQVPKSVERKKCFLSSCYYIYSRSLVLSLFSIITVLRDLFSSKSIYINIYFIVKSLLNILY